MMKGVFLLFALLFFSSDGEDTGRRRSRFDPTQFGVLKTLYPEIGRIHSIDVSADGNMLTRIPLRVMLVDKKETSS